MTEHVSVEDLKARGLQDFDVFCEIKVVVSIVSVLGIGLGLEVHECGRPADWMTTCRACGRVGYLCDGDRVVYRLGCSRCGVRGALYFDFVRIPRPVE